MQLARIDGSVVSTVCHPSMRGTKTLLCQPVNEAGLPIGTPVLALDNHGAGLHSYVLLTTDGSSTQLVVQDPHSPLRNMSLGVLDVPPVAP